MLQFLSSTHLDAKVSTYELWPDLVADNSHELLLHITPKFFHEEAKDVFQISVPHSMAGNLISDPQSPHMARVFLLLLTPRILSWPRSCLI
jgi:hypothetical protein